MVHSRAQLTHTAPSSLLQSPTFPHLLHAFSQHLPLHNLHWKSGAAAGAATLRTVQELQIDLVPLENARDEQASQVPASLLEKPLMNVYFVVCEDNDTYKNTVRKQIRDWVALVSQRRNQEWLVVLVVRPETRPQGGRLFQIKSTMLDRLKSDFNSGKKDHCTQLNWSMAVNEPAGWADLIQKLKEGIIASFDAAVVLREEEVKRSESQRHMPGWNFCTFFVLKESLALSYEGMNLLEDALTVYDELELSFYQVLREMNLSWFGKLGGNDAGDDSAALLSLSKKPYRDLMITNTITVFDFRCYLLARQCSLLGQMLKVTRLARKAAQFITCFALTLEEESKDTFPEYFLESWQYSSAISVVDQCQAWARTVTLDSGATAAFNGAMGELLELARNQLDKIGLHAGHLPAIDPFGMLSRDARDGRSATSGEMADLEHVKITNKDLLAALESREAFDRLYIAVTKRAIEAFVISKRKRFALRLHFSLAVLDVVRGRHAAAQNAYKSLPPHYAHSQWASIEAPLLCKALSCHAHSQPPDSVNASVGEWVADALSLMKSYVMIRRMDSEDCLDAEYEPLGGAREYFAKLVEDLRAAAEKLEDDLRVTHHPALSILLTATAARPAEGQDGSYLDVTVVNSLPCDVSVDRIEVLLAGLTEGERVSFVHGATALPPGRSSFTLFCSSPAAGLYVLDSCTILLSRISFFQTPASEPEGIQTVRLPADHACTTVLANPPRTMHLDQSPRLLLTVVAGRNRLQRATFSVSDLTGNVSFEIAGVTRETEGAEPEVHGELEVQENGLQVTNLARYSEMELLVPYYGTDRGAGISLLIEGTYVTEDQPDVVRTLRVTPLVRVTLPMAVNVQDFFRGTTTFSKFSVASDGQQYLRLLGATLVGNTPFHKVQTCRSLSSAPTIVSPSRQASFVFRLAAKGKIGYQEAKESLRVVITYRSLWDEMSAVVTHSVRTVVSDEELQDHSTWLRDRILEQLEADDIQLERYCSTGHLQIQATSDTWTDVLASHERGKDSRAQLLDALSRIVELINTVTPAKPSTCSVRTLSIPVDVPITQILNSVRIELPKQDSFHTGQPISATLSISTTVTPDHADQAVDGATHKMGFDVIADFSTWLVSGKKRGEYIVNDDTTISVPITLVPIRQGALFLPQVSVYPVPADDTPSSDRRMPELPSSDTYQANAAETVLVHNRAARKTYMPNPPTLLQPPLTEVAVA